MYFLLFKLLPDCERLLRFMYVKGSKCFKFEVITGHFSRLGRSYLEKARKVLMSKNGCLCECSSSVKVLCQEECHKSNTSSSSGLRNKMRHGRPITSWNILERDEAMHGQQSSNWRLCYAMCGFKPRFSDWRWGRSWDRSINLEARNPLQLRALSK